MTSIEEIYQKLTNVDINEQKLLWDERGRGYYGEFLVFCELYPLLPGNCKILMNVNIPALYGKTTEIDLLLIHETGIYVFEMKHYKGTIYGKPHEQNWTQYFRTAPNQHFRSPIAQNQYHIEAIKRIAPDIPVHSFIVFTSDECDLKVECNEPNIVVCTLPSLRSKLSRKTAGAHVLNKSQINHLFCTLIAYSPTTQHNINVAGKEIPFYEFVSALSSDYLEKAQQLNTDCQLMIAQAQKDCQAQIKKVETDCEFHTVRTQNAAKATIITAATIALASIIISLLVCTQYKKHSNEKIAAAQRELATFAQKFEHVEEYNNGEIHFASPLVTASDIVLETSKDLANTVNFSCRLNWAGEEYGMQLTENTQYIIILKDGTVREYNLFTSDFPYYSHYKFGKGASAFQTYALPKCEFYELSVSDIAYIKLINNDIWKYGTATYGKALFTGYEVELYRAE